MPEINIANSSGRDALVAMESVRTPLNVRWVDGQGRQIEGARLLKGPIDCDVDALLTRYKELPAVGKALIEGDPEVDLESTGRILRNTSRVYVNADRQIVHRCTFWEIVRNPDGSQRDRRSRKIVESNVSDQPLRWSGVYIKREQACRKFVFSSKVQLHHTNGLTYDFLYGMAKELEDRDCLMLLGAGSKSKEPLILRRAGSPYRGFLEGRTQGDKYLLVLHFSDLELKVPTEASSSEAT